MTKGFKCNGCGNFTKDPVKVQYPSKQKKLDYLGTRVQSGDVQDDEPDQEHYCAECGKRIHSIGDDENDD